MASNWRKIFRFTYPDDEIADMDRFVFDGVKRISDLIAATIRAGLCMFIGDFALRIAEGKTGWVWHHFFWAGHSLKAVGWILAMGATFSLLLTLRVAFPWKPGWAGVASRAPFALLALLPFALLAASQSPAARTMIRALMD